VQALTPASCDLPSDADPSDGWEMIVIRRHGAPPLRFAGRALCCGSDGDLSIRILQAKTGGFILAHSVETPGGETASRHALAEEAMLALEQYCRTLEAVDDIPIDVETSRRLHLADLLEEIARLFDWRRRFRTLAGETLDAFERRLDNVAPLQAGGLG
jgi:hypothetical protein